MLIWKKTLHSFNVPKLSNEEAKLLEGNLRFKEVSEVLKNMKNDKSPGADGFTAEFFKFFFGET